MGRRGPRPCQRWRGGGGEQDSWVPMSQVATISFSHLTLVRVGKGASKSQSVERPDMGCALHRYGLCCTRTQLAGGKGEPEPGDTTDFLLGGQAGLLNGILFSIYSAPRGRPMGPSGSSHP